MAGAISSSFILTYYGRKTMMVLTVFGCGIFFLIMGFCEYEVAKTNKMALNYLIILSCCCYLIMFQWGPGPIAWIYMSEVMNNKGVAVGTLLNIIFKFIFALFTSSLFNKLSSATIFFGFGII